MMKVTKRGLTIGGITSILPIIAAAYAFGIWSGVMWVTLNEFEAFKVAQAGIDEYQNEENWRIQRRHDREDYNFYLDRICNKRLILSIPETEAFEDILDRLGYLWPACNE